MKDEPLPWGTCVLIVVCLALGAWLVAGWLVVLTPIMKLVAP